MRPTLNILSDDLIARILDEAKRILAETGMEIRGPAMRQRLLDHGLPLDASGQRVLFPRAVVERPSPTPPRRSSSTTATATRMPTSVAIACTSCPVRAASRCSTTAPARLAWRTPPTSSNTCASATA